MSGRVYQHSNLQAGGPSRPVQNGLFNPVVQNNVLEEDVILRQLAKVLVAVSIWGLLSQSRAHRQKLIQMLSRMEIALETTPEGVVALLTPRLSKHVITFTEADLPIEGARHNKPLHITLKCMKKWVLVALIDNDSALNVCPLRTIYCLGLKNKDFSPSD